GHGPNRAVARPRGGVERGEGGVPEVRQLGVEEHVAHTDDGHAREVVAHGAVPLRRDAVQPLEAGVAEETRARDGAPVEGGEGGTEDDAGHESGLSACPYRGQRARPASRPPTASAAPCPPPCRGGGWCRASAAAPSRP